MSLPAHGHQPRSGEKERPTGDRDAGQSVGHARGGAELVIGQVTQSARKTAKLNQNNVDLAYYNSDFAQGLPDELNVIIGNHI